MSKSFSRNRWWWQQEHLWWDRRPFRVLITLKWLMNERSIITYWQIHPKIMVIPNAQGRKVFCVCLPTDDQTMTQVSCSNMLKDWDGSLILLLSSFYNHRVQACANSTIKRKERFPLPWLMSPDTQSDHLKRSGLKQQHNCVWFQTMQKIFKPEVD